MKPAWSWQFAPGTLQVSPSLPREEITRDWAWGGSTGANVKVAVIDSGIDAAHPEVRAVDGGAVIVLDPQAPGGARAMEGPHEDLFGHGTACASIIRRAAPDARLYSIRVLGEKLTGKGVVFSEGIRWAIEHEMDVVNMSLSSRRADYFGRFHELADTAYFKRVMLVCAANNTRAPSFPSLFASVFSVAANAGTEAFDFDYNPEPPVEFGAPGIDVRVAWLDGTTIRATGNSFAAPHITGIVARILSKHPGLTPFQMKTILASIANNSRREKARQTER